jgi:uncharacterized repeat protein (TIGR01451 family)
MQPIFSCKKSSSWLASLLAEREGLVAPAGFPRLFSFLATLIGLLGLVLMVSAEAATPPNTPVINVVTATYRSDGKTLSVSATSAVNTSSRTPATISLLGVVPSSFPGGQALNVNPGACQLGGASGNTWQTQTTLQSAFAGSSSAPATINTVLSNTFSGRDVIMIAVSDPDQNRDPLKVDRVIVEIGSSRDRETLQLAETGPSTGYFLGWVQLTRQTSSSGDCRLAVSLNETIRARYTDINDSEDTVGGAALVDPYGVVFNSQSGEPVNGAQVTMIDTSTGQPATVFGDDGVSAYPSTYLTGRDVTDASGVLYSLGAGRYRFPLVAPGVYRLQVLPPDGFSFPSTAPENSVKKVLGESYIITTGAKGESFPVPLGPAVRVDIPLDPRLGKLLVSKTSNRVQAAMGDLIRYEISVRNSDQASVSNVLVFDRLPRGLRLRAGSIKDKLGKVMPVTQDPDGRGFQVPIGTLAGTLAYSISYVVEVTPATPIGAALNEAYAVGGGATSNAAGATVQVIDDMLLSRAILVGTVFEGGCPSDDRKPARGALTGVQGARIILQDGRFANTDANGKWHIEGIQPGTNMVRLDGLSLPRGQVVLPCVPDPRRSAGHMARTLDVRPGSLNRVDFYTQAVPKAPTQGVAASDAQANSTPTVKPGSSAAEKIADAELAVWQRGSTVLAWAYPLEGFVPPEGYQSFLVSHAVGQRVVLEHQGQPVPGFHYEGTRTGPDGKIATSLWRNVHLQNGSNHFVARIFDSKNQSSDTIEQTLHLATSPVRAELVLERSRLVANGRDPAMIAVRLLDALDQPVRRDITGEFTLNSPYVLKDVADAVAKNPLAPILSPTPRYVVNAEGIALIALAPTTQSGEVEVNFNFANGRTQVVRAWLQADQRDWIVVGFAEGSPVGAKLRESMQAASGMTADPSEIRGERLAIYAKGTIPGEALLTLAYDSAKPKNGIGSAPQAIPLAPFYTVYSDQSQGGLETPSWGKLYLKIEKSTFVALLGNSNTGLTMTELGRYARAMYGLKSSWQGERMSYTAFAMRNLTSFHRDIFRADGTTGSWQLSRQSIVPQTERVRILTRDRLDAGNILSELVLARATDYSLDYVSGRLLMAQPVASFDAALNPVTIEVEFSTENLAGDSHTLGARVALKASDKVELGLTLIEDNDTARGGRLGAIDVKAKLGDATVLRVEAGKSSRLDSVGKVGGDALLTEIRHDRPDLTARVYYRRTDTQYGLNEQPVGSADLQSLGAEVRMKLSQTLRLESQLSRQQRLSTGQTADIAQMRVVYGEKAWQSSVGLRIGLENDGRGRSSNVGQVLGSLGYLSPDQKWSLRATGEVGVEHGASLFPNRLLVEGDYRLTPSLSLTASQSWIFADTHSTALAMGLRYKPWSGAELQTGLSHRTWADGDNTAARVSLVQTTKLDSTWTLNAQVSGARRLTGSPYTPLATGTITPTSTTASLDDFTTAGFTLSYAKEPWTGYVRSEKRWADDGRYSVSGGISRKLSEGEHLLATARIERFAGDEKTSAQLSIAHALRRHESSWTLLHRLDLIDNNHGAGVGGLSASNGTLVAGANSGGASGAASSNTLAPTVSSAGSTALTLAGRRLMLSAHWNYLSPNGFEWLNHIGVKRVLESLDEQTYGTKFGVIGTELRQPINKYFDVGVHAAHAKSFSSNVSNTSYGVSVGFRPIENTLITVGYNFRGIKDADFYAGNQRAQGMFVWMRALFDEKLLGLSRPAAAALSQGARP